MLNLSFIGKKTLWEKNKVLVTSSFSLSHDFFSEGFFLRNVKSRNGMENGLCEIQNVSHDKGSIKSQSNIRLNPKIDWSFDKKKMPDQE